MPSISAPGIGSGLDIGGLVEQLVQAETSAKAFSLARRESTTQAKISAFGTLQGALSALKTKADGLVDGGDLETLSATSSSEDTFTAIATSSANASSYSVEVIALAQAHKLASGIYASGDDVIGTGDLTIEVGSDSFTVTIDGTNNTVSGIMDAINDAADNAGVRASLITAGGDTRLVLTSEDTGLSNSLRVTQSGGDGGLAALVYDPGVDEQLSEVDEALDSQVRVDGFLHTASSNNVDDVLPGVTLQLKAEDPGNTHDLYVQVDVSTQKAAVQGFVQSFNAAIASISTVSRFDSSTNSASALTGDATVRQLGNSLRSALSSISPGLTAQINSLAEIGIDIQVDGSLVVDEAKLEEALANNPERVHALLSGASGIAVQISAVVSRYVDSGGRIPAATERLDGQIDDIAEERLRLEARASALEARYSRQFSALDGLIAQLNSTSEFLTSQLSSLASFTTNRNSDR